MLNELLEIIGFQNKNNKIKFAPYLETKSFKNKRTILFSREPLVRPVRKFRI